MTRLLPGLLLFALLPCGVAFAEDQPAPTSKPTAKPEADKPRADKPTKAERKAAKRARKRAEKQRRKARGNSNWTGVRLKMLEKHLGLTPDQLAKLKEPLQAANKQREELMAKMRKVRQELREFQRKTRKDLNTKMKEVLTKEQQQKYRELVRRFRQRGRRGQGPRGRRGGIDPRYVRGQAIKDMKLTQEESAVIVPLLDTVLQTGALLRGQQAQRRRKFLSAMLETTDEAQAKKLLKQFRKEKAEDAKTIAKSRAQLREVLTPAQEAKLVAWGVLD